MLLWHKIRAVRVACVLDVDRIRDSFGLLLRKVDTHAPRRHSAGILTAMDNTRTRRAPKCRQTRKNCFASSKHCDPTRRHSLSPASQIRGFNRRVRGGGTGVTAGMVRLSSRVQCKDPSRSPACRRARHVFASSTVVLRAFVLIFTAASSPQHMEARFGKPERQGGRRNVFVVGARELQLVVEACLSAKEPVTRPSFPQVTSST